MDGSHNSYKSAFLKTFASLVHKELDPICQHDFSVVIIVVKLERFGEFNQMIVRYPKMQNELSSDES